MDYAEKDRLADEIAELVAQLDVATHRLLMLIGRFDESGGWGDQGALTCAHWLSWRVGLELGAAREHVRVARALPELPSISDAMRLGQLSYSKVRALTRVATPDNEAVLVGMARASTASQLERICRGYRRGLRSLEDQRPEDEDDVRWVRERETETGFVRFDVQVTPAEAAMIRRAMEVAASRAWSDDVSAGTRIASLRRADALVAVAETYLSGSTEREAGPPVEVVLHVEAEDATLDDGTALPPATKDRLLCDAAVVTVREDSRGNVLDVGRRRRTIPTLLRRALNLRDRGCRFPGCTNRHVDGHHVIPWARGGTTSLDNLCSLCRRHHTYVHEMGFRIAPDGESGWRFHRPDGREIAPTGPVPPIGPVDPIQALRRRARADGITVDATTNASRWEGGPFDLGHIVSTLMPMPPHVDRTARPS